MQVRLNVFDYSPNDLLFAYWLRRKLALVTANQEWRGASNPQPNILHVMIDKELDKLRKIRNRNLPLFIFDKDFNFAYFKKEPMKLPFTIPAETPEAFDDNTFMIEQKN